MKPRYLISLLAVLAFAGATADSGAVTFNFQKIEFLKAFKTVLPTAQANAGVPIRVPRSFSLLADPGQKLYTHAFGDATSYDLDIAYARNCGHATACFGAHFGGERGNTLTGGAKVTLAHGLKGRYFKTSCGASCAKPQVEWIQNGVRYTVQLDVGDPERSRLIALANAAIRAPRL
jgi:hypothetical protein